MFHARSMLTNLDRNSAHSRPFSRKGIDGSTMSKERFVSIISLESSTEKRFDVFLSHNSQDKPAVSALADWLGKQGVKFFLDGKDLEPGDILTDALAVAIEKSRSTIICIGPHGEGPWQKEEIDTLLNRSIKLSRQNNEFRIIPVLLPKADTSKLRWFLETRLWCDLSRGITESEAELFRLKRAILGERPDQDIPVEPTFNPYQGLRAFDRDTAKFFFGRGKESCDLAAKLSTWRFACILGASGNGKSSLARAGLSSEAAERIAPGISQWQRLTVKPGNDLLRSLLDQLFANLPNEQRGDAVASALARIKPDANQLSAETWAAGLDQELKSFYSGDERPVLILIDQFEEIFTHRGFQTLTEQQRERHIQRVLDGLAALSQSGHRRWRMVVTLRSDFKHRCRISEPFWKLLYKANEDREDPHLVLELDELEEEGWREAIKGPATRAGAYLEAGLVETMLKDVFRQRGSMPLLQLALQELWKLRNGACLTHAAYTSIGGVASALQRRAETAFSLLKLDDPDYLDIARSLFLRLTSPGEGVSDTRRRVERSELDWVGTPRAKIDHVVDTLSNADNRLIVTDDESLEVTHEVLIRDCSTIRNWIESDRPGLRIHRQLTEAAGEWLKSNRDPSFLYRGIRLTLPREWEARHLGYMSRLEREFMDRSRQRHARESRNRRLRLAGIITLCALVLPLLWLLEWLKEPSRQTEAFLSGVRSAELNQVELLIERYPRVDFAQVRNAFLTTPRKDFAALKLLLALNKSTEFSSPTNAERAKIAEVFRDYSEIPFYQLSTVGPTLFFNAPSVREFLTAREDRLLAHLLNAQCKWADFKALQDQLGEQLGPSAIEQLWVAFEKRKEDASDDSADALSAFRAGIILADRDKSSPRWKPADYAFLAIRLVQVSPEDAAGVRELLKPVANRLQPTLRSVIVDQSQRPDQVKLQLDQMNLPATIPGNWKEMALHAVADYFGDDEELLCDCACQTIPTRFRSLLRLNQSSRSDDRAKQRIELLRIIKDPAHAKYERESFPEIKSEQQKAEDKSVRLGTKRAAAAIALMQLGGHASLFKETRVLEVIDDPEAQSQFIHRFREFGVSGDEIWTVYASLFPEWNLTHDQWTLDEGALNDTRYALLICLGKIGQAERFSSASTAEAAHAHVKDLYQRHPSSAIHGAARWLLTQWNKREPSREPSPTEIKSIEAEFKALDRAIATQPEVKNREWFARIDRRGFVRTFVKLDSGKYRFGTPKQATKRWQEEWNLEPREVNIEHPFAICTQEVTREEFEAYCDAMRESNDPVNQLFRIDRDFRNPDQTRFYPNAHNPMGHVRWFDAVRFCRWLTENEDDQCYDELPQSEKARSTNLRNNRAEEPRIETVKIWDPRNDYAERRGYRLPTEIEWEYACRGGTVTSFGFGSDYALTTHYAWFLENREENLISKWGCQRIPNLRGLFDIHGNMLEWCQDYGFNTGGNIDSSRRVIRGGGWEEPSHKCRSGWRYKYFPNTVHSGFGFRLVCKP